MSIKHILLTVASLTAIIWGGLAMADNSVLPETEGSADPLERGLPVLEEESRSATSGFLKLHTAFPVNGQPVFGTYGGETPAGLAAATTSE